MPAIVTKQLTKHFSAAVKAVDGIDLEVSQGQIFAFLGANGSGKSTTIRMLTTLLRPTSGEAKVLGLDVAQDGMALRGRIGVALQEAGLDDLQTGRELLRLQCHLYGLPSHTVKQRTNELLKAVDLEEAADRRVGTYSGGMRRRIDLASALVHRPELLFLDEPTTGLDPISREALHQQVLSLNRDDGVTFFLTTQYLEEADKLADEVAIIDRGKIVAQGSPAELKATIGTDVVTVGVQGAETALASAEERLGRLEGAESVQRIAGSLVVYIREGSAQIAPIVQILSESGLEVQTVTLSQPTLDDVFLRKTGHHMVEQDADEEQDETEAKNEGGAHS